MNATSRFPERAAILLLLLIPLLQTAMYFWTARDPESGYTQYFLTYGPGFQRRALIGEILSVFPRLDRQAIVFVGFGGVALLSAVIYLLFGPKRLTLNEAAVFAFITSSPGFLPHYSYWAASLDSVIGTVGAVSVFLALSKTPLLLKAAGLLSLTALGSLVHEGYLLLFAPIVFAAWFYVDRRRPFARTAIVGAGAGSILIVLALFYSAVDSPVAQQMAAAMTRTDAPLCRYCFKIYHLTPMEQVFRTWNWDYTPKILISDIGTTLFLAPVIAAFAVLLRRSMAATDPSSPGSMKWLVWLACLAPLALFVVGCDVARWTSMAFTSAGLLILALRRRATQPSGGDSNAPWFWPVFCFSLINGPLHAVVGTSLLERLAQSVSFYKY